MTNGSSTNEIWQQALKICKDLIDLNADDAIKSVKTLDVSKEVQNKAIKIIQDKESELLVLDSNKLSSILNNNKEITNDNLIGKEIGSYKIIALIAKGGMSAVYKAISINSQRHKPVALKILSPYVFSEKSIELFNREQLILSKLEHPNIISFHHSGKSDDGTNYLVMEYIAGAQEITNYVKENRLSTKEIVKFGLKIANVFAYSHNNLIIHRDIKPSNLLVDKQGHLKVIDFGIGQITSKSGNTSTQVFTLDTASPEQIQGENVSIQSDVFSLGAVFLQLLVNKKPLPKINIATYNPKGDEKHIAQLLSKSKLDSDLKNILLAATHIDTKQRYRSMEAFANDLSSYLYKQPIRASSDSSWYKSKKFIQRNPLTVALSAFIFLSMLISLIVINNYANTAKLEAIKASTTLDLFTQIFSVSDPSRISNADITVDKVLDHFVSEKLNNLVLNNEIKYNLHLTIGEIYANFQLYNKASTQYQQAYELISKNTKLNKLSWLQGMFDYGVILIAVGKFKQANVMLEETLTNIKLYFPQNKEFRLDTLTSLMGSFYYSSNYDSARAQEIEEEILIMLASKDVNSIEILMGAYSSLANKAQKTKVKNYATSEKYIRKEIELSKSISNHDSITKFEAIKTLSSLLYHQKKFIQAEELLAASIKEMEQINNQSPTYSSFLSDYSSILFINKKYNETFTTLTKAVEIAKSKDNKGLIYRPLSKRAMYHIRLNHFSKGIKDQIETIPIIAIYQKHILHSALNNLALMFYSIGFNEIASQVYEKSIESIELDHPYYKSFVASYYLELGVINWFLNNRAQAKKDYQLAQEFDSSYKPANERLLRYLLFSDLKWSEGKKTPKRLTLINNLINLLKIKNGNSINKENLSANCKLPVNYKISKNHAIKQMYLNTCIELHQNISLEPPDEILVQIKSLKENILQAQSLDKNTITQQLKDYLHP